MIKSAFITAMLFGIPSVAFADVYVSGTGDYYKHQDMETGKWEIEIYSIPWEGGNIDVYCDSTFETIAYIKSYVDNSALPYTLRIEVSGTSNKIHNIESVSQYGETGVFLRANITNDFGSVYAEVINITAGGDITGTLTAFDTGSIGDLIVTGNITGNITANQTISKITAGGTIGTPQSPITISSGSFIRKIKGESIYANISAVTDFGELETTDGDFDGSLTCDKLTSVGEYSDIVIAGSLDADITINDPEGLESYIIINTANDSTPPYWLGDVTIDTTTLSPKPLYTNLSGDIGGAAVGVVPFMRHALDCVPRHGTAVNDVMPEEVVVRHYGPVVHDDVGLPVTIYKKSIALPSIWVDDTANYYAIINGSDITLKRNDGTDWKSGYDYLVQPVVSGDHTLNCNIAGDAVPVSSYLYVFRLFFMQQYP